MIVNSTHRLERSESSDTSRIRTGDFEFRKLQCESLNRRVYHDPLLRIHRDLSRQPEMREYPWPAVLVICIFCSAGSSSRRPRCGGV